MPLTDGCKMLVAMMVMMVMVPPMRIGRRRDKDHKQQNQQARSHTDSTRNTAELIHTANYDEEFRIIRTLAYDGGPCAAPYRVDFQ
jgi:hypothetical protein